MFLLISSTTLITHYFHTFTQYLRLLWVGGKKVLYIMCTQTQCFGSALYCCGGISILTVDDLAITSAGTTRPRESDIKVLYYSNGFSGWPLMAPFLATPDLHQCLFGGTPWWLFIGAELPVTVQRLKCSMHRYSETPWAQEAPKENQTKAKEMTALHLEW